jgi:magnesium-transporting ATPase (P-type)
MPASPLSRAITLTTEPGSSNESLKPTQDLTPAFLASLVDPKNLQLLTSLGGPSNLTSSLSSHSTLGLSSSVVQAQTEVYGSNALPPPVSKSFLAFVIDALGDKTLLVLIAAAVVELAIGGYKVAKGGESAALMDGGAILVAGK